jgi:hypothetical protein
VVGQRWHRLAQTPGPHGIGTAVRFFITEVCHLLYYQSIDMLKLDYDK